jgi:hypothetical protein
VTFNILGVAGLCAVCVAIPGNASSKPRLYHHTHSSNLPMSGSNTAWCGKQRCQVHFCTSHPVTLCPACTHVRCLPHVPVLPSWQVSELQAASAKLARDKASLAAELTTLRDELGCCCCGAGGSMASRSPAPASPLGTPGEQK